MMPKPSLAAILVCGFLATGCRSAQRKEEVCLGNEFLGVRNETGESVDIFMVSDGLQRIVGTVGSGRTELPLPPETARNVSFQGRRTRDGRWLTVGHRAGDPTARLTIQVQCDTPRP
jgi:hypothetical protein